MLVVPGRASPGSPAAEADGIGDVRARCPQPRTPEVHSYEETCEMGRLE